MNIKNYFFLSTVLLALCLRLYKLGLNPPSLYWDEVSLGYNAYSILKTGRDEFGEFLPHARFIAFGDYKPVGYVYAAVPFIWFFGLSEISIRLPSALSGVGMVIITYFLAQELLLPILSKKATFYLSILSSLLLAISPWSLHLSRGAFEANLAAFFNLSAIYLFIKGMKKKNWLMIVSFVFFVTSCYTFNGNRALTPILILGLLIIYFKRLLRMKKWVIISFLLGSLLALPLLPHLLSREGRLRFTEVNIFSNLDVIIESNKRIALDGGGRIAKLIHHRFIGHSLNFLSHYFDHFKGNFLFIEGDVNPRLSARDVGELYLWQLPFFLAGFYFLFKNFRFKASKLILFWFFVSPLPAATARETPHALRILSILPTPQLISTLGFFQFFTAAKEKIKIYCFLLVTTFLAVVFCFAYYLYEYYVFFPTEQSGEWLYGYKQMVEEVSKIEDQYQQVKVTAHYSRPYIYFLFYRKYPPEEFWQQVKRERDWYGFWTVYSFGKYKFGDLELDKPQRDVLYVSHSEQIPSNYKILKKIADFQGKVKFVICETI